MTATTGGAAGEAVGGASIRGASVARKSACNCSSIVGILLTAASIWEEAHARSDQAPQGRRLRERGSRRPGVPEGPSPAPRAAAAGHQAAQRHRDQVQKVARDIESRIEPVV